jgi:hypothetical protein
MSTSAATAAPIRLLIPKVENAEIIETAPFSLFCVLERIVIPHDSRNTSLGGFSIPLRKRET